MWFTLILWNYLNFQVENAKKRFGWIPSEESKFHEEMRPRAIRQLKRFKIVDAIGRAEKIKATQQEVDAEIKKIAESRNETFERVKEALRKSGGTMEIRESIKEKKVFRFLLGDS